MTATSSAPFSTTLGGWSELQPLTSHVGADAPAPAPNSNATPTRAVNGSIIPTRSTCHRRLNVEPR